MSPKKVARSARGRPGRCRAATPTRTEATTTWTTSPLASAAKGLAGIRPTRIPLTVGGGPTSRATVPVAAIPAPGSRTAIAATPRRSATTVVTRNQPRSFPARRPKARTSSIVVTAASRLNATSGMATIVRRRMNTSPTGCTTATRSPSAAPAAAPTAMPSRIRAPTLMVPARAPAVNDPRARPRRAAPRRSRRSARSTTPWCPPTPASAPRVRARSRCSPPPGPPGPPLRRSGSPAAR